MTDLNAPQIPNTAPSGEDTKLLVLARNARARTGASQGAAVRDATGRTYLACTVALPHLSLSALQAAVALAVASGARALEAAAVVGMQTTLDPDDLLVLRDLAPAGTPVLLDGGPGGLRVVAI